MICVGETQFERSEEMKFRFTAEHFQDRSDFCHCGKEHELDCKAVEAANIANALLEAEEEKCERVYSESSNPKSIWWKCKSSMGTDTHTALLWNVEKIETEIAGIKIVADPKLKDGEAHFKSDYVYCNRCDGPCYCDRKWGSK